MSDGIECCKTTEMKREYMCGLQNFLADKPPPLAEVAENSEGKTKDSEGKKVPVVEYRRPPIIMVFDHSCRSLLCQCVLAPSLKFLLTLDSCILEKVLRYLPLASYLQYWCGWYHKLFLFSQIIALKVKDLLYF